MACDPATLANAAKCFNNCLNPDELDAVFTNLLCGQVISSDQANAAVANWIAQTAATSGLWRDVAWSPSLNLLAAVSESPVAPSNKVMTSPDAVNWTLQTAAGVAGDTWRAIAWSAELGLFVAVAGTGAVMTSSDGVNWTLQTAAAALSCSASHSSRRM